MSDDLSGDVGGNTNDAKAGAPSAGMPRFFVSGGEPVDGTNIDKIRDILFGQQSRDIEKRMARLDERLIKEVTDLREEYRRRFDALELYARKELEALADRLNAEQAERVAGIDNCNRALSDIVRSLERQIGQLDGQVAKGQRDLREQNLEQSKGLSEDIRRTSENLSGAMGRAIEALRHEKADRAAVSTLLTEMALRLSGDLTPSAGQ
jgi:ABC-type transporter Mla subunit MlaD